MTNFKAETEKDLGNDAYKKKDFDTALKHYQKAAELCPTVITYLTNQAGRLTFLSYFIDAKALNS